MRKNCTLKNDLLPSLTSSILECVVNGRNAMEYAYIHE